MFNKVKSFFQEGRQEFNKINWPTFPETRKLTFIVIGFSLATAIFLGILDIFFSLLLNRFILS